jgi:hypothetical protein
MTGAFKKNPARRQNRVEAPLLGPLGDPPARFLNPSSTGTRKLEIWFEKIAEAGRTLTVADRNTLERLCDITVEAERVGCKLSVIKYQVQLDEKLKRITDESRAQMNKPSEQPKDAFEKFMQRAKKTG